MGQRKAAAVRAVAAAAGWLDPAVALPDDAERRGDWCAGR